MIKFGVFFASMCVVTPVWAETTQTYPVSELYVLSMDEASLQDDVLTLEAMNSKVIWFTDRPQRQSGVADTHAFIANWPIGDDSLAVDPPNAVLVGSNEEGEEVEIAMELTEPAWASESLTLRVLPLSDPLPTSLKLSSAHLFIDNSSDDDDLPTEVWCGHECFRPIVADDNGPGAVK